jgi:DNA invertase Pin-like site-specific DNA recombinase
MFEEVSKNRRFGYARVSSQTQEDNSSLEAQKQEFIQKGVPEKKYSGRSSPLQLIRLKSALFFIT